MAERVPASTPGGVHRGARSRAPVPVVVLVAAAVGVLGLLVVPLLAAFFTGLLIQLIRLALVLAGFCLFALIGLYLWRRGDVGRLRPR